MFDPSLLILFILYFFFTGPALIAVFSLKTEAAILYKYVQLLLLLFNITRTKEVKCNLVPRVSLPPFLELQGREEERPWERG